MLKEPIKFRISKTPDYQAWLDAQSATSKTQIESRMSLIECHGHFGDSKKIDTLLWELRWKNGRRIYFGYLVEQQILLLLGGNKNGQQKDINQAKKIISKYCGA